MAYNEAMNDQAAKPIFGAGGRPFYSGDVDEDEDAAAAVKQQTMQFFKLTRLVRFGSELYADALLWGC